MRSPHSAELSNGLSHRRIRRTALEAPPGRLAPVGAGWAACSRAQAIAQSAVTRRPASGRQALCPPSMSTQPSSTACCTAALSSLKPRAPVLAPAAADLRLNRAACAPSGAPRYRVGAFVPCRGVPPVDDMCEADPRTAYMTPGWHCRHSRRMPLRQNLVALARGSPLGLAHFD